MNSKALILFLIAINWYSSCGAAQRRIPKVYNALITTDENLTTSRAYPVIQPTIHETGIPHFPFGPYNPYSFYNPPLVGYGQPIVPGLVPRDQLPYPLPQGPYPTQVGPQPGRGQPQGFPGYFPQQNPPTAPMQKPPPPNPQNPQQTPPTEQQPMKPTAPGQQLLDPSYMPLEENRPQQMPGEKVPIPLNEYGLPPALIPLPQYPNRNGPPFKLPPYGFNQYPVSFDPITGYPEQYLPPYEYYPSHTFAVGLPPPPPKKPAIPPAPEPTTTVKTEDDETTENELSLPITEASDIPNFDSIKNGSKSKNSAVPDVPPPPIPGKPKQS